MHLDVRGLKLDVTEALAQHIERRLTFALGRYDGAIYRVEVRVTDVNGARGGLDKQCKIRAVGRSAWQVFVTDTDADLYSAVDRAADRIGRAVGKTLERRREAVQIEQPFASL